MKNLTKNIVLFAAVITFGSCHNKPVSIPEPSKVEAANDSIEPETEKAAIKSVEGTVLEINPGKDGYTAKVETADKEIYFVTISHSNLTNHEQFKTVKIGEKLNVTGDFWKMENDNQITVRSIN